MISFGVRMYALGALALGLVGLVWGDFALVWQPVPAGVPGRTLLAYLFAGLLSVGALATNVRRSAAGGAALLCGLFALVVVLLHVPHIITHPFVFGTYSSIAEQLALSCGGLVAYALIVAQAPLQRRLGQDIFALCLLVFGAAHFFYLKDTAELVPAWLPPGQRFWAILTGVAHIAAGAAILTRIQARLAAVLLTIMFASFSALIHIPLLWSDPHSHFYWVMNAMNAALTGSAWVIAASLGAEQRR
jgi:uncharacterized membrane protein